MLLKKTPLLIGFVFTVFSLILSHCAQKQFSKGNYSDLKEEKLLDDRFNPSDMQRIVDKMVPSLVGSRAIADRKKPPVVLVTLIKNKTQEHIDMKSLTDKIKVGLMRSGRFQFTEKENREELQEELGYQGDAQIVDPEYAKKRGKQIGADFFLTGELTDRVQEVGSVKIVYYKCTFNLVNIRTGLLEWADDKEIEKAYKKRSIGF